MATIDTSLFPSANVRFQMAEAPSGIDLAAIQQQKLANQVTAQNLETAKRNAQRQKMIDAMRDVMGHETPEDAITAIDRHVVSGDMTPEQAADAKSKVPTRAADGSLPQGAMTAWRQRNFDDYLATNEQLYESQTRRQQQQRLQEILNPSAAAAPTNALAPAPADQEQALFNQLNPQPAAPAAAPSTNALISQTPAQTQSDNVLRNLYIEGTPQALAIAKQMESENKLNEPNWVERSDNQNKWYEDINPRSSSFGQTRSKIAMKATPGQELTADIARERLAKSGISQAQYPLLAQAILEGRAPPSVNSRTAALYEQVYNLNPNADIASSYARSKLLANSVFQNRALTAQALPEQLELVRDSGKKLNFSPNLKKAAEVQKWFKDQSQDPLLVDYIAKRNDVIQSLAYVMRNSGMTEGAVKLESEANTPTMSPAMLDAWMEAQMAILKPRLKQFQAMSPIPNVIGGNATPPPAGAGAGGTPPAATRTVVRKGTAADGRKVVQYSDGSVEYAP